MTSLHREVAALSAGDRQLFELLLREQGVDPLAIVLPQPRENNAFPLSFAQQRLWFLDQLQPGSAFYNIPVAVRLAGHLDPAALQRSLNAVVDRHEVLRTSFQVQAGTPRQVVGAPRPVPIPVTDLSTFPKAERMSEARRQACTVARAPFDLARGSLLRAMLLRLAADDHLLVLSIHHVAADVWSLGLMMKEIAGAYAAYAMDLEPSLPDLPVQYADFAIWQRAWLDAGARDAQLQYWRRQLAGAPPLIDLPADHLRPPMQTFRGRQQHFVVGASVTAALRVFSQQERVTPFMTLLAAFSVLLSSYTRRTDIVVGSPVANRNRRELENLIGFFANTLVLRADLSGNPPFRETVRRVRDVSVGAFAHQDLPFDQLVEDLHPGRALSHSPLFQVMFVLQNAPVAQVTLPGLTMSQVELDTGMVHFDVTLRLWETARRFEGRCEYNSDLFDDGTIRRLRRDLQRILATVSRDPDARLETILPLTPYSARKVLGEWCAGPRVEWTPCCVHGLVEEQAARTPARRAVVGAGGPLTYGELDASANRLASYLEDAQGIDPEARVAVCLPRSVGLAVAALAVWKAGGVFVPLDAGHPAERLAEILADARARLLITDRATAARLAPPGTAVLYLDEGAPPIARPLERARIARAVPDNAAYIMYTSGSTGVPRGVVVTHASVSHYVAAMSGVLGITARDRYLHTASFGFSSSMRQLLLPLTRGGTVVIADPSTIADPPELFRLIARAGVTVADFVPSYWRSAVQALRGLPASQRAALLDNQLRLVVSASEPLPPALPRLWRSELGAPADLLNMFGQTETTGIVATCAIGADGDDSARCLPIGRPIARTEMYLLDRMLRPVLPGTVGQLHIGGPGLARGYWGNAGATAARFVPHPFGPTGERLYRTGDLARFHQGGILEFVGREDHQVKVRGVRVESGDIEAQLARHPDVQEAAVVAVPDSDGERRLIAHFVPTRSPGPTARALREFLRERLPAYMLPETFIVQDALPRTSTGKIDRRALPAPPRRGSTGEAGAIAPRTPTEEVLVAIWQEALRLETVSVDADFFDLGGHSLLASQVISRIRDTFEVELPIRTVFEETSVAMLAAAIDAARDAHGAANTPPIVRVPRQPDLPTSFAQERLWFLDQLQPLDAAYVMPAVVRLTGPLDVAAFEKSLNAIIRRHEALRSSFRSVDGRPVVSFRPELSLEVPLTDLQGEPVERREQIARELAAKEGRRPFDLQADPLIRARLLRLGLDDHVLVLAIHHIVADGWSVGLLIRELAAAYGGDDRAAGDVPLQYADFAAWQREWVQGDALDRQLAYWREQLRDAEPILALPTDYPRRSIQSFRSGAQRPIRIAQALTAQLRALSRAHGVTLFMTLLGAYQVLLARYAGQLDVSVGTPIAGRTRSEFEGVIGLFVNTLILRGNLGGNPTFSEFLRQVRGTTLGAYAHQDVPFERLIEALQPGRGLAHTPLVQVMLVLQNAPRQPLAASNLTVQQLDVHNGTTKFDLTLGLTETSQGLWGSLEYDTALFSPATIDRLCGHFEVLLEHVASHPECRVADLPLMREEERRQLLATARGPATDYGALPIPRVFERRASEAPDATAVICDADRLSYVELDRQANGLAHHLTRLGVGPDVVVGVLLDRSPALPVALLAILKAGGAYLPLDPSYPAERLRFMARDAGVPLLLTETTFASGFREEIETICLDLDRGALRDAIEPPRRVVDLENLAYVTYTSGSTGVPKGVAVTHRAVLRLVLNADYGPLGPTDGLLQHVPLPFDASTWEIWGALLHGGRLVLFPGRVPSPDELADAIARHGVTALWLTGSLFNTVMEEAPQAVRGLQQLLIGGESLSVPHVRRALRALPETRIVNGYGPTENTTFTTCHAIPPDLAEGVASIPIGRPIANTDVHLLDGRGGLVPIGVAGELHAGGHGLARGYYHRPALTAERFVPHPFADGERLYRTGDMARWLADGTIEFLGRRDLQVKVRGMRIELGEIESVLSQHPAVKDVAVVMREMPGGPRLAAHVALRAGDETTIDQLRRFLQSRLPEHMVPAAFIPADALPLSPNQKIDRRALTLSADDLGRVHDVPFVPPRTDVECAIAEIWKGLLGREQVGIHDNFFEIGGHSLLAMQMVSRARVHLGVSLRLRTVFDVPTIGGLAEHIEMLRWAATGSLADTSAPGGQEEATI